MEHPLERILRACDDHSGKFPRLIVCQGSEYWTWEKYNKFKFK
ncbi:hypothetical protein SAMN05661091_5819 [Paenibacillus uliginis N3/975]|uniref:Uncharacterized protein n=1 Tax=Paenibacillus uliginis N3/975 TaxID=1313296 RepID=A0A1X7HT17_9BACL|nr:hypothetical protein SAMN05661091_5819 [Paenibacillus uliginis N3/975]